MQRLDNGGGVGWNITYVNDVVLTGGPSKVLTMPADFETQILWVYAVLTSSATVGNRQLEVTIRNISGAVIGRVLAGVVQAASLTRNYMFAPSLADLTDFRDTNYLMTPFPPTIFLPAGAALRVWDNKAISGNDTLLVYLGLARREL